MSFLNKNNKTLLIVASFILLYIIFSWINYLVGHNYIKEGLNNSTTDTVDMPINTIYSCKNFCGPAARCAITGQQCFTDLDCPGCKKYIPPVSIQSQQPVPGDNDAGKLTWGVTPQYSKLTNGYGTNERLVTNDLYDKPAQANFGINTWRKSFDEGSDLFNKRYKPSGLQFMPNYKNTYSLTGEFNTDGPLPSNASI
jgi:hypothetical protein